MDFEPHIETLSDLRDALERHDSATDGLRRRRVQAIRAASEAGMSQVRIAEISGISRARVRQILDEGE